MKGRIHSLESFGTQDGPGIRFVVFMQGCRARCRYCHNPDTWAERGGREMEAGEVFARIEKGRTYYDASGGGVTASGGEPLLQAEFLTELFGLCRAAGIHTAMDTAGFIVGTKEMLTVFDPLIALTDLFIVDLKWAVAERHKELTGRSMMEPLKLIERLERAGKPYWLRQVLVPGLNDGEEDLRALKTILAGLRLCEKFEFLPYHTLGRAKWAALGKAYALEGHRAANEADVARAMKILDL